MNNNKIEEKIEEKEQDIINLLKEMIAIKSVSGQEAEMADYVKKEMLERDYDEVLTDSVGNILGRIGNGDKVILFDAHMDTVPVVDNETWDYPSDSGKIVDQEMYGRGSCDDKGCLAAFISAGEIIKELGFYEDWTIYITGTIMEEVCEGLALGNLLKEIEPDYVIIGEPSELKVCRGHRGRVLLEAIFKGKAVHASVHDDNNHAIYKANPFIQAVPKLNKKLPVDSDLGQGDICVTKVECESNSLNSTPSSCRVILDRRTTTTDSRESILEELKNLPGAEDAEIRIVELEERAYTGKVIEAEEYFPAWTLPKDHKIVKAGATAFEELFDKKADIDVWGFSTDGNYSMGKKGIPTLGFGPGDMSLCHAENERLDLDQFFKAISFYAALPAYL